MPSNPNLLICLKRWASQQDENFTTDALAHYLMHLAATVPTIAADLITYLSGGTVVLSQDEVGQVEIETQRPWPPHGTPDVTITTESTLFLIEVKVASPVDISQLNSYLNILENDHRPVKRLTLLT